MSKLPPPTTTETAVTALLGSVAKSQIRSDDATFGVLTPISSATPLPATPAESESSSSVTSEATAELREVLDRKLEALVLERETVPSRGQPAADLPTEVSAPSSKDRFGFECAFGFTGALDEPSAIPNTKGAFTVAIRGEMDGIGMIQRGLQSYQHAINSRKYHTFSTKFLIDQNTATVITLDQLDQIAAHLRNIEEEVQAIQNEQEEVKEELMEAFKHVQPWVMRTRAILRHCHVFYKINFVLASEKKTTQH